MSEIALPQALFLVLSVLALVSAILVITCRNVVYSAIALIVTLFSVAGVFLLLRAEFLFAVQIILYVGGITVLYLFVIMLVNLDVALRQQRFGRQWLLALLVVALLSGELIYGLSYAARSVAGFDLPPPAAGVEIAGNTQAVGKALYQAYMLPVEIASLLLLVAMVGAVLMAKRKME